MLQTCEAEDVLKRAVGIEAPNAIAAQGYIPAADLAFPPPDAKQWIKTHWETIRRVLRQTEPRPQTAAWRSLRESLIRYAVDVIDRKQPVLPESIRLDTTNQCPPQP